MYHNTHVAYSQNGHGMIAVLTDQDGSNLRPAACSIWRSNTVDGHPIQHAFPNLVQLRLESQRKHLIRLIKDNISNLTCTGLRALV